MKFATDKLKEKKEGTFNLRTDLVEGWDQWTESLLIDIISDLVKLDTAAPEDYLCNMNKRKEKFAFIHIT